MNDERTNDIVMFYNIGCFKSVFRGLLSYHKRLFCQFGNCTEDITTCKHGYKVADCPHITGKGQDKIYTAALETAIELLDKEERRLAEKLGLEVQEES